MEDKVWFIATLMLLVVLGLAVIFAKVAEIANTLEAIRLLLGGL